MAERGIAPGVRRELYAMGLICLAGDQELGKAQAPPAKKRSTM